MTAENQELHSRMQAFSTPNDILPGFIRASDQAVDVKCQLSVALPNSEGQPQVGWEHVNIGDEGAFNSKALQAVT
ncbi:hypothetical protein ACOSQ3_024942 [Xanthoceras sorbifolium]